MSEEPSIESRKRLQALLESLKTFQGTVVHTFYVGQCRRDLDSINERILEDDLVTDADIYELFKRRGMRFKAFEAITFFEDAVATLEGRVEELLNQENQTLQNQQNEI